ncbi:hypothetical protein [Thiocapsa bogorovii]|uniref:hypothetical protein n=1 Tax=Thiocapsa bogorovii TaxID=521689 RepID=UPI001E38DC49|nr:hypothetical protein [Thiocapsa bogorovii]UHD15649.1 hypothetical protein LT988_20700 [Thiocapsa bogorovii]
MTMPATVRPFLQDKVQTLIARARRLSNLTPERVGLRAQDRPYAPSAAHFAAANRRLREIDRQVAARVAFLKQHWRASSPHQVLVYLALVEREIDRARRAFGMFFEVFSQRGSAFAPALAAHDAIAMDCYAAVRRAAPLVFRGPLLKPLTYMEHGYSPATTRRGIALSRLLGEPNPFPLIRIPWDRDNPWQAVFLHEVSHNLQADLGLWQENQDAVVRRLARTNAPALVGSIYRRWHKEIFADLAALLLGGPAAAWGMLDFLAHPAQRTVTYQPGGAHPTGYLRALILAEMLARMGFDAEAGRVREVWKTLYRLPRGHRIPTVLLSSADGVIPAVVDEVAFQTRRGLAQRALADVILFRREDERAIRDGAKALANNRIPADLPPRFLVSASRYALGRGASAGPLSDLVIRHLSKPSKAPSAVAHDPLAIAA